MSELFAAIYDPVLAPLEVLGLRKWRIWATGAAQGRVLEIGVGTGLNLQHYPSGQWIVGIDPDGASLRYAQSKQTGNAMMYLHQARAEGLPFADESFDAVIATLVFCSVADPALALGEARRVLKSGGALRLLEHVRADNRIVAVAQQAVTPIWKLFADGCRLNRDTLSAVKGAGFRVQSAQKQFAGIFVGIDALK